jgi:anaerobic magnesium-protoporphyrin IX monomethyl ester cyclase
VINFVNVRSPFLTDDGIMPPLGLFYLISVLKKAGIDSQIIDLGLGEMIPDGPIFITGTTPQHNEMLKAKRNYTAIGGPHASINYEKLSKQFELVVVGEGEEVIEKIVKEMPTGIIHAPRIKNLDNLPFPDRTTAHKYNWKINGKKATTLVTSRGCTGRCSFCCKAVMNKGIYLRSVQNIIDELVVIKHFGFEAVMFYDDSIAINKERLINLCKSIKRLGFVWRCFVRSDQMSEELFQRMAEAGCYEVLIGIESGSNRILKNICKNETVEQHKNAVKWAKMAGIKVKALMIAGLPGENWESIEESKNFIKEAKPDSLDVTILSVYPGCDIHTNPQKYDIQFTDPTWYKGRQGEYQSTVKTSFMTEKEIVEARNVLWETFKSL